MNQVTPRLMALCAFASSALALCAATPPAASYSLNTQFTNSPPRLLDIGALPKAATDNPAFKSAGEGLMLTDGAGKIHGVQSIVSDLGGGTQVVFTADVAGAIVGRGKTNGDAAVRLTIKGSAQPDGGAQRARMNLTFKGATGIMPNAQTIMTADPGYNIRLGPDGTTNTVERYDPWTGVQGLSQGWTTYSFEVHSYRLNTRFLPAGSEADSSLLVSNTVNAAIQHIDLAGYDHYNEAYVLVKFGTPIKRDRGDGYFGTNSYGYISMHAADGDIAVPLWIVSELVQPVPNPDNPACFSYTTNTFYGADIADLPQCLGAYHSFYDTVGSWGDAGVETNYSRSLIVETATNAIRADLGLVVKNGRRAFNCWNCIEGTLDGTISAGKTQLVIKQSPATFEEEHELWTLLPSAPGEESYLIQPVAGSISVLTNDLLAGTVQQSGRQLKFTSDPANWGFKGSGTVHPAKGTYAASLKGLGSAKGATLQLKGATRPVITGYEVITNAPAAVKSIVNVAADGAFTLSVTNTTSGRLSLPAQALTVTNLQDNVVSVITYSYPAVSVDNFCFKTNTALAGIDTVIANGKVMGQKWVANTVGFNQDAAYPDPLPVVPAP